MNVTDDSINLIFKPIFPCTWPSAVSSPGENSSGPVGGGHRRKEEKERQGDRLRINEQILADRYELRGPPLVLLPRSRTGVT
jgi:hypothetical protein